MAGTVRIAILANASQATRELNSVAGQASGLGSKFAKFGRVAAAGLAIAGAGAVKLGIDSVKAASDLQETVSKTGVVFGKAGDSVLKWSKGTATSLGQSQQQALDAAATFGVFGKSAGKSGAELAKFAKQNTTLASDLASFHNTSPEEAIAALGAAFRGEAEPMRRFGVLLDDASMRQQALKMGLVKTTKEALSPQNKVLAAQALIMKQTKDAQGDFARTSGGLANQQRILSAQFANFKATIGAALLPVVTQFVTFLNGALFPALGKVKDALTPVIGYAKALFAQFTSGTGQMGAFSTFIQTRVIPAVQQIVAAFQGLVAVVVPIVRQIVTAILANWSKIQPQVKAIWSSVKAIITSALSIIKSVIMIATKVISAVWAKFGATILRYITTTMRNMATVIGGVFKVIEGIFKVVSSVLRGDWKGAWDGIKKILSGALAIIKGLVSQAFNVIRTLTSVAWTAVKAIVSKAWDGIVTAVKGGIGNAVASVSGLKAKVTAVLSGIASWLYSAGRDLIQGLINGVKDMASSLASAAKDAVQGAIDGAKSILGIHSPSRVFHEIGLNTMRGFINGIKRGGDGIDNALSKVTDGLEAYFDGRFKKDKVAKAHTRAALKGLRDEYRALVKNGKAQDALAKRIEKAKDRLTELKDARKSYAASIKSAAVDYASVTNLNTAFNADAMLAEMKRRLAKIQQFAAILKDLVAKGLNATTIDQLAQAGVEGGLAEALAIQQGGQAAIDQFNEVQQQINAAAGTLGNTTAGSMYDAGIQAAEGFVKGLEKAAEKLDKAAVRLAKALVNAIKKALGIKSPSKVFEEIGLNAVRGLQIGLDDTYVKKSGTVLAASLEKGFGTPALKAYATTSGQGGNRYFIEIKADATTDSVALGRSLVSAIDAYEAAGGRRRA